MACFFLGITEAAVGPGFSLITSMFYKRNEQALRHALWFAGNCVANIVGGLVSYSIGNISSSLPSWKLLFLILGSVTTTYSSVLFFMLPDSPLKARFLTSEEKQLAVRRVLENGIESSNDGGYNLHQMLEALKDPQSWLLFLYTIAVNIPNGGITSFASLIIAGFGFSRLTSLLVTMPIGGFQLVALGLVSIISSRFRNMRLLMMIAICCLALLGISLVYALDPAQQYGRLVGIWLAAIVSSNLPLSLSLISSNVAGFTKKATVSAMLFIAYCIGNIIGPQFFIATEAPTYPVGIRSIIASFSISIVLLSCLYIYYTVKNRRRDENHVLRAQFSENEETVEDSGRTDRQLVHFRYVK